MPFGDIETHRGFTRSRQRPAPGPPELPVLIVLEPETAPAGTVLLLRIHGRGLHSDCHIFFAGNARGTTFISETLIETSAEYNVGSVVGEHDVRVYDTRFPGFSNTLLFTVT